jgi:hypothetical protein
MLLAMAERRLRIAERLARCFPDRRDPTRITRTLADMIRTRVFAISCGYEDADENLYSSPSTAPDTLPHQYPFGSRTKSDDSLRRHSLKVPTM